MVAVALALLAGALAAPTEFDRPRFPGDRASLVVTDHTLQPIAGVAVTLWRESEFSIRPGEPDSEPVWRGVSYSGGEVRLELPAPGDYFLLFEISGFHRLALGPFQVCPRGQRSCGPVLVSPTVVILPHAAFLD